MHALTSLRGIAALLVVVYHFSGGFLPNLDPGRYSDFVPKGYLWVDLFFVLSGFIITHAYGDAFAERARRGSIPAFLFAGMARIYPVHLFFLCSLQGLDPVRWGLAGLGQAWVPEGSFSAPTHLGAPF